MERHEHLKEALTRTPAVRPEVVARGKALAVDPNYPPLAVIESLASLMTSNPDVSFQG